MSEPVKNLASSYNDLIVKPYREDILLAKIARHLGVEYIDQLSPQLLPEKITPEHLKIMPSEWRLQLYQLATQLDGDSIVDLIEKIPTTGAFLSKALEDLVSDFNFEKIIELTQPEPTKKSE